MAIGEVAFLADRVRAQDRLHKRVSRRNNPPSLDAIRQAEYIAWVKGANGSMLAVSKGYTALTGIAAQDYEGSDDVDMWGDDGERFLLDDEYVRNTGYPLVDVEQAWWSAKDQTYMAGLVTIVPYPLGTKIGTLGRLPRDTVRIVEPEEYKRIIGV